MAMKICLIIGGFLVGIGLCLAIANWPKQNSLWIHPDTGYLVWTDSAPSGEYVLIPEK